MIEFFMIEFWGLWVCVCLVFESFYWEDFYLGFLDCGNFFSIDLGLLL